jgi:CRISPR-associated protein (TIGR03986 family)
MNPPQHIRNVSEDRRAVAPYNFVELPDQIVEILEQELPARDQYHTNRLTGRIECTLTTESPLYIRCGLTPNDFATWGDKPNEELSDEERNVKANFFSLSGNKPVIPGSSLRGMFRSIIEIISYSKMEKIGEDPPLFFRAVATTKKSDSLAESYKAGIVKAGYLLYKNNKWKIQPAKEIEQASYAWVKERDCTPISDLIGLNDPEYHPQYIQVTFDDVYNNSKTSRKMVGNLGNENSRRKNRGVLVTSGNMKQNENVETKRRNHCIVFEKDESKSLIAINPALIDDYCKALTDFQKDEFSQDRGFLKDGRPVFYVQPKANKEVEKFGQSPNFRHPYLHSKSQRAARAIDFLPEKLRDKSQLDLVDAIFGFVDRIDKKENESNKKMSNRSGRVFFGDAIGHEDMRKMLIQEDAILVKTLLEPKASTFQHYLVQPESTKAAQNQLMHYAKQPETDTVIRGHKLYWHKSNNYDIHHESPGEAKPETSTWIKPIDLNKQFSFTIGFENLSEVELGAIQWVLAIAADPKYRLSLGMGKPLGMGAIKIESKLFMRECKNRYQSLFDNATNWNLSENESEQNFSGKFEDKMLTKVAEFNPEVAHKKFKEIDRIKMLLTMLSWIGKPNDSETRYLEIERSEIKGQIDGDSNEYKKRRVLPTPLQIATLNVIQKPIPKKNISTSEYKVGDIIIATITSVEIALKPKAKMTVEFSHDSIRIRKKEIYKYEKRGIHLKKGDEVKLAIEEIHHDGTIKRYEILGLFTTVRNTEEI